MTTSAGADLAVSYSRSPRTQLGVSVSSNRVVSCNSRCLLHHDNCVSGTNDGKTLVSATQRRDWCDDSGSKYVSCCPRRHNPLRMPALVFEPCPTRFWAHTTARSAIPMGWAATSTSSASGSWRWARPGRSWWIESTVGWQQLAGGAAYANSSGWRAEGGFGRAMGNHLALRTQCVYLHFSQQLASVPPLSQTAVRVSMIWNPDPHAFR